MGWRQKSRKPPVGHAERVGIPRMTMDGGPELSPSRVLRALQRDQASAATVVFLRHRQAASCVPQIGEPRNAKVRMRSHVGAGFIPARDVRWPNIRGRAKALASVAHHDTGTCRLGAEYTMEPGILPGSFQPGHARAFARMTRMSSSQTCASTPRPAAHTTKSNTPIRRPPRAGCSC